MRAEELAVVAYGLATYAIAAIIATLTGGSTLALVVLFGGVGAVYLFQVSQLDENPTPLIGLLTGLTYCVGILAAPAAVIAALIGA